MFKRIRVIPLCIIVLCFTLLGIPTLAFADEVNETNVIEERYSTVYSKWKNEGVKVSENFYTSIFPEEFTVSNEQKLVNKEESHGYEKETILLSKDESIKFQVEVPEDGLYEINMDYYPLSEGLVPIQGQIKINGMFKHFESRRIIFPVLWENETVDFTTDRNGNEIMPLQKQVNMWMNINLRDSSYREPENLKFNLKKEY